jgi:hypothetical protein
MVYGEYVWKKIPIRPILVQNQGHEYRPTIYFIFPKARFFLFFFISFFFLFPVMFICQTLKMN